MAVINGRSLPAIGQNIIAADLTEAEFRTDIVDAFNGLDEALDSADATMMGDVTATAPVAGTRADNVTPYAYNVTINTSAVTTDKLNDDAVTAAKVNADVAGNGISQATDGSLDVSVPTSTSNAANPVAFYVSDTIPVARSSTLTFNASTNVLTVPSITIGPWTLSSDGTNLTISNGGNTRVQIDPDGHLRTDGDITAFDTSIP